MFTREQIYRVIDEIANSKDWDVKIPRVVKLGTKTNSRKELDKIIVANSKRKRTRSGRRVLTNKTKKSTNSIKYTKRYKEWIKTCKDNKKRKGLLYIVLMYNDSESFIKVGITTAKLKNRFKTLPYKYKTLKTIEYNVSTLYITEQLFHRKHKKYQYWPDKKFSGMSECYKVSYKVLILKDVTKPLRRKEVKNIKE